MSLDTDDPALTGGKGEGDGTTPDRSSAEQEAPAMRVDRRMSPNQTALWTVYELRSSAAQRPAAVRLPCYYRRSTGVNGGQPSHRNALVRGDELGRPPIFQAGHAGSIPVTRSITKTPSSNGVSLLPGRHPADLERSSRAIDVLLPLAPAARSSSSPSSWSSALFLVSC